MKNFNCRGSRWNSIEPETNKSMKKAGYVLIRRPVSYSQLKRYGQMVTCIDVMPSELPESIRDIGLSIIKNY